VLLSRASYSVFGLIARGRVGSAFIGLLLAAFLILTQWFLALYFPDPLRWPVAIMMVLLGTFLLYQAIRLTIKSTRPAGDGSGRDLAAARSPRRGG
jgi:hypothetical protein